MTDGKPQRFCKPFSKSGLSKDETRPFQFEEREGYLLFGWGSLLFSEGRGSHYFRLRKFTGGTDPCLPGGMQAREKLANFFLDSRETLRETDIKVWRSLLTGYPTHVIRFGWKTPLGSHYDIIYLPLNFGLPGYYADGLAKSFAKRFMAATFNNASLIWYLFPSRKKRAIAAIFWLGAAFSRWLEEDLKMGR